MNWISNLPEEVRGHILEKMPIEDAIKTSVLSRSWRNTWTTVSNVTINGGLDKSPNYSHFLDAVTNVLHRLVGPINRLNINIPHLYEEGTESFDNWFLILSVKGVKELSFLNFHYSMPSFYKLPSHFFSFEELTHLRLYRCSINPPSSFSGFPKLISLELLTVSLVPESFGHLITSCPLLESFNLDTCKCDHLIVISPSLKHLLINASIRSIYIEAENLKTLSAVYNTLQGPTKEINILHHRSAKIPQIETICLGRYILKFVAAEGDISKKLPMPLTWFKKVKLVSFDIGNPTEVASALELIHHSPNLEELKFSGASGRSLGNWEQSISILGSKQWRLRSLLVAKFSHNKCTTPELKMMSLILAGSPSMKKMVVKLTPEKYREVGLGLWKELMCLPRLSPEVKILVSLQLVAEKEADD